MVRDAASRLLTMRKNKTPPRNASGRFQSQVSFRSVIAAQRTDVAVAIDAAIRTPGAIAISARAPVARTRDIAIVVGARIVAPAGHRRLVVGRLRRPGART